MCKFYNNHYWLWLTWCKSLNNLIIPVLLLQLSPFCAQLLQPTVFLSDGSSHARNVTYQIDQIQSEDPTFRVRYKLPVHFFDLNVRTNSLEVVPTATNLLCTSNFSLAVCGLPWLPSSNFDIRVNNRAWLQLFQHDVCVHLRENILYSSSMTYVCPCKMNVISPP